MFPVCVERFWADVDADADADAAVDADAVVDADAAVDLDADADVDTDVVAAVFAAVDADADAAVDVDEGEDFCKRWDLLAGNDTPKILEQMGIVYFSLTTKGITLHARFLRVLDM